MMILTYRGVLETSVNQLINQVSDTVRCCRLTGFPAVVDFFLSASQKFLTIYNLHRAHINNKEYFTSESKYGLKLHDWHLELNGYVSLLDTKRLCVQFQDC